MTGTRINIHGPIPHPSTWCISPDPVPPPGFMRLAGCCVSPRRRASAGTDLVLATEALPSQLERLLRAFERLDEAGRAEVLACAELLLAGAT